MTTPTPRLGAALDVRFGVTVEEALDYLAELGLDHVEFKREYLAGHPDTPAPTQIRKLTEAYDSTVTYHAPFRDWNIGSFNDAIRETSVARVKRTIDDAADVGATAVVVHGGSVPRRYPDWIQTKSRRNALRSLMECAEYAQLVGVPLCIENQPESDTVHRYTTTPSALQDILDAVDVPSKYFGVTLDVGHAKANGQDWRAYVKQFGDAIQVCHLHDNDGSGDDHEPVCEYDIYLEEVPATSFVFEMKSLEDIAACMQESDVAVPESVPSL